MAAQRWPDDYRPFDEDAFYQATARMLVTPPAWQVKARRPRSPLNIFRRQYLAAQIYARRVAMEDIFRQIDEIAADDGAVTQYIGFAKFSSEAQSAIMHLRIKAEKLNDQSHTLAMALHNLGGPVGDYRAVAPRISPTAETWQYTMPGKFLRGEGPLIPAQTWVFIAIGLLCVFGIAALVIIVDVFGG